MGGLPRLLASFKLLHLGSRLFSVLDSCSEGIGIYNHEGRIVYQNAAYQQYDFPNIQNIYATQRHPETGVMRLSQPFDYPVSLRVLDLSDGFAVLVTPHSQRLWHREKVLHQLADGTSMNKDVFVVTAQAIGRTLPWRWVGVTRFLDPAGERVQVLGWWDKYAIKPSFELATVGTPCEVVARTGQYCFFSSQDMLKVLFPHWELVEQLQLSAYAGLVYRSGERVLGHIITMHDGTEMDGELTEDVMRLATHFVGSQLELASVKNDMVSVHQEARIDDLTMLKNNKALQEELQLVGDLYRLQHIKDAALVMCDLDGLKAVNDTLGHYEGDQLLKVFAEILRRTWRYNDGLFRRSGDEFILILRDVNPFNQDDIDERLRVIDQELRAIYPQSGSSAGVVFLSEHDGEIEQALLAMDCLLYQNKRARKDSEASIYRSFKLIQT